MIDAENHGSRGPAPLWWCTRPWNASPLLRGSDRMEFLVRTVLVGIVLVALPVAMAIGTQVYTDDAQRIRAERAGVTTVEASVTSEPVWTETREYRAKARWNADGHATEATVTVPEGTGLGDTIPVWLGADGTPTRPPRGPAAAVFNGIGVTILLWAASVALAAGVWHGTTLLSDRRHARQWEREWALMDRSVSGES
ncbi:hypothetical protein IU433_04895 [Nocardia puris]|uniref:Uncharacterized protein n=1 Tax=Nocardia puris TaxID=208602 RepID=A0A366E135_9NOCA|nr:hypothetical protein [Nocardia puris]MBF6209709.1 hypothetical protein [Nocardia puris]MBF6366281.1 hypothetical protein [Nocardia puris]MBF6458380.1 hypothetical protein [Nocardia puris]RBO96023.1 hypothetical protein DFR74_10134 [Nocardia puris]